MPSRRLGSSSSVAKRLSMRLDDGRTWWAHIEFTRVNTDVDFPLQKDRGYALSRELSMSREIAFSAYVAR
jgi:hypothetical protein